MRITDDHGQDTRHPRGGRPVTQDGRLVWVGPVLAHHVHEYFLDGKNLGSITEAQARAAYDRAVATSAQN